MEERQEGGRGSPSSSLYSDVYYIYSSLSESIAISRICVLDALVSHAKPRVTLRNTVVQIQGRTANLN